MLQLRPHDAALAQGPLLQDADRGRVREGLDGEEIVRSQATEAVPEEVEGADRRLTQAEGNGMHRFEAQFERPGTESGPLGCHDVEVGDRNGPARRVALYARSVPGPKLEDFDEAATLVGRGDNLEFVVFAGGEDDADGGRLEQEGALVDERVQQVDDVVADDECVRQSDEGLNQLTFTCLGHHEPILRRTSH